MNDSQQVDGRALHAPAHIKEINQKDLDETPSFPDEIAHLICIKGKLNDAIKQANESVAQLEKEYMDTKGYMVQYRGEVDPREMFQNELALKRIDNLGAFAVKIRNKLAQLLDSPYFARIDFREASQETPGAFYIGRFAFGAAAPLEPIPYETQLDIT